jgi:hypothetical protein
MQQPILLSSAYLPSVYYLKQILLHDTLIIEKQENFTKQTYRNRCDIVSANGLISLSIPLIKQNNKELISEKKNIIYRKLATATLANIGKCIQKLTIF